MYDKKRVLAFIMSIVMTGILLFSCSFIIENAHHHCLGEKCPVCLQIELAAHIILNFRLVFSAGLIIAVLLCVITMICTYFTANNRIKNTLITLKVELLD